MEDGSTILIGQSKGSTAVINASLYGAIKSSRETGFLKRLWGLAWS